MKIRPVLFLQMQKSNDLQNRIVNMLFYLAKYIRSWILQNVSNTFSKACSNVDDKLFSVNHKKINEIKLATRK